MHQIARQACLAVLLTATLAPASAGPAAAQAATSYSEDTTVLAVEVPVFVTQRGDPVRGLTAENFQVFEGRRRLEIVDFEEIDLEALDANTGPMTTAVPAPARRRFLLLFDLSFSSAASVVKAREAAHELVANGLHPTDLAAVATYSAARGAEIVLGFTADRRQLAEAIDTLGVIDPVEKVSDPLQLMVAELESTMRQIEPTPPAPGQQPTPREPTPDRNAIFLETLRDLEPLARRTGFDQRRNDVLAMSSSFSQLAELLRSVEGSKQIILFSEGFDSSVLLGTANSEEVARTAETAAFGETWRVDSDDRFGSSALQQQLFGMLDEMQRCDCTIQAVDIGGVRAGPDAQGTPPGEEGLFVMADHTGGSLFRNYNRLSEAMNDVLERTTVTYLLVVEPQGVKLDGSFHEIEVRLKKAPKGVRVSHRPGYYAARSYAGSPAARLLANAGLVAAGNPGGEVATTVLTASFPTGSRRSYVAVWIEAAGFPLLGSRSAGKLPLEVYVYAFDQEGSLHDYLTQSAVLDLDQVGQQVLANGFKFLGHLNLPPGDYSIRTLVRNAVNGASGVQATAITVPRPGGQLALAPPLFIEPEGTWVEGWESRASGGDKPYPLASNDRRLVPAAHPILPAGREIPLLITGSGLDPSSQAVRAFLEDEGGRQEVELAIEGASSLAGCEAYRAKLRFGEVPPGNYRLVLAASDSASGSAAESSIPIFLE